MNVHSRILAMPRSVISRTHLAQYLLTLHEKYALFRDHTKTQELAEIWQKTFLEKDLSLHTKQRQILCNSLRIDHYIHENVVLGKNIVPQLFPLIESSIIITDRTVYPLFQKYYNTALREAIVYTIDTITGDALREIIDNVMKSHAQFVVGIGGGRVMDILKFIQMKIIQMENGKFFLAFPTSLATHVYASPKIHVLPAIAELGYQSTIDGPVPDLVVLDTLFLERLQQTNPRLIRAGLGDIMAYITAVEDWKLAEMNGKDAINNVVVEMCSDTIKRLHKINVQLPLSQWIQEYSFIQVLLCNITDWVGSPPASGSEHLFAKEAEEGTHPPPLHGELVALGTLIMTKVQGGDCQRVHNLMKTFQLPTSLSEIGLTVEQAVSAMQRCRSYGRKKERFTIAEIVDFNKEYSQQIIEGLIENGLIHE